MEIAKYNQMMSYLTRNNLKDKVKFASDLDQPIPKKSIVELEAFNRFNRDNPNPRTKKSNGGELIAEPPKSMQVDTTTRGIGDPLEDFKEKADRLLQGSFASTNKDFFNNLIEQEYQKALDAGVRPQEALSFLQERSKMYRTLADEGRRQGEPAVLGPTYSRQNKAIGGGVIEGEDLGTREGFKAPKKFEDVEGAPGRVKFDTEKQLYRKDVQETVDGKKTRKYIYSNPGESLDDFLARKPVRATEADDATVKSRQFIDNWTKGWFDNNLKNYGVRDFDVMINDLSKDWSEVLESGDAPKAKGSFNLSTPELGLPNVTSGRDAGMKKGAIEPFSYNNVKFYANLESSKEQIDKTLAQYKKIFYKNKIETDPNLRTELGRFFNFMAKDKRGLYRTSEGQTISKFMDTVSDDVKYLLNDEASGLKRSSKKEVFNAYEDLASNYNKYTQDKARLKAVQSVTEAKIKAGPETSGQTDELIKQIKDQNKLVAKMSPEELAKNKNFIQSLRLVINPKTGEVSFSGYTENDPKVKTKGVKSDLELAEHAIERAKDPAKKGGLFGYDHISKREFGKMNTQYPNNIQSANYITNSQLENARRFLSIPENRNTPAAQNLDKVLEDLNLTIRGTKEYGGTYGNKSNIVFDSKTKRSNIVDSQLFKNVGKSKTSGMSLGAAGDIPMAKEILKKDFEKLKSIFGSKAARQIAGTTLKGAGSVYPFETLFMGDMQQQGLSPKEMALDIGTLGLGTIFKDIKEKFDYVKSKGLGDELQSAFRKQTINQQARPTLGGVEGMFKEQTLTPDEQAALRAYNLDAQNIIDMRRSFQADEYRKTDEAFGFDDPIMRGGAMDGGIMRLGFADGPEDPSKRKFMKVLGGLTALPFVGKFFKIAEKAAPIVDKIKTTDLPGKPEWFDALVNKVIREGTDMTKQFATKDREIVHATKISEDEFVRVHQDLETGSVRVDYDSPFNMGEETVSLEFRPGIADETTKGKPRDEFQATEVEPRYVGGPEDADMEFDGIGGGSSIKMLESDVSNLERYATGKGPTMKEFVESKKRKDRVKAINEDQMEAAEYISGKYGDGPEPDYDDFID